MSRSMVLCEISYPIDKLSDFNDEEWHAKRCRRGVWLPGTLSEQWSYELDKE